MAIVLVSLVASAAFATAALAAFATTAASAATAPASAAPASAAPASAAPASTPASTPAVNPVKATLKLYVFDAFSVDKQLVTIPHRSLKIGGVVRPYVAGEWVTLKAFLNGKLFKTQHLQISPSSGGTYGHFTEILSTPGVGDVTVRVSHKTTPGLLGFSGARRYAALDTNVGFGSTGRFVQLVQQRLAALHFYIPQTGVYDTGMGWAIDAYHRLLRRGVAQTLDPATITWLLNGWGAFPIRFPSHGKHAEGNLSLQLLALANGSHVYQIYPISSGKPSTPTILGDFQVYMKDPGYLSDGMYYSNFFYRGYAIHGYDPAPDYPASHGCMRVPIPDAISIYDWLDQGDWVDVYY